jgi:hypothetical protein
VRKLLSIICCFLTLASANAQIVGSPPFTLTNGSLADATQVMANFNSTITQVNANAANNGANANITSLSGLTTPLSPVQGGSQYYSAGIATGTANAIAVASGIVPAGWSLTPGKIIAFISGASSNTGPTTLSVAGGTATNIFKRGSTGLVPLIGGEIVGGSNVVVFYDGTQFDLITSVEMTLLGKRVNFASGGTTDLGTAGTHTVYITGGTTITSFGSTAQIDFPLYFLEFSTSLTLTYNGVSLILPGLGNIVTQSNDTAIALYLGSGNWQIISYTRAGLNLQALAMQPTVQTITVAGAGTYTPTTGTVRIHVRMVGGGGGGGASATNAGSNGGFSGLGSWIANPGSGGGTGSVACVATGAGGSGGANGTGTLIIPRIAGQRGGGSAAFGSTMSISGAGGSSPFGGAGSPVTTGAGVNASANSGSGGSGAANSDTTAACGGGAGEYVDFFVFNPGALAYTVGSSGAGGVAGGNKGGDGATGSIAIEEYYN